MRGVKASWGAAALLLLGACNRHQSALDVFGAEAATVRHLTVIMLIGAIVIAAGVAALMVAAVRAPEGKLTLVGGMRLVGWLGGVLPVVVLLGLLLYSLPAMRPLPVAQNDLRIAVEGEQFWWRVRYQPPGAAPVVTANEIRIPVGRTVQFDLTAGDVIHSFWIPGLAGKMDMIPGRTNTLVVRATKAGKFRGVCTEFCGLSHALMAFDVVAMEPAAFDAWLANERRPAVPAAGTAAGARAFAANGCTGCHAIAGTPAAGLIGPDLTHIGSRTSLGAGTTPMTRDALVRFIVDAPSVKPGARMPAYPQLPRQDAQAIAAYLESLK
ncbi:MULTISPECIES: cytochrome c oxidase subunit II [unclassified Sphingomonas]|uniref:cytochrome c oxidase subunit II n=1 Tax=unclassified Sphingomonas TaxID=196159 RepID=UPI0006F78C83|nr:MULTISPECIES: cytochrome c oxidase subunit II [unclassified Sphingomonas]KQM61436.1 cytochrome B [Sphingomonas sp. Leaf16]KQN12531.1 cytochrome B [Sphingomonas sp. Leaf29]KQN19011.1 cytochrome B [Sphingomonas sp. Leaf32]